MYSYPTVITVVPIMLGFILGLRTIESMISLLYSVASRKVCRRVHTSVSPMAEELERIHITTPSWSCIQGIKENKIMMQCPGIDTYLKWDWRKIHNDAFLALVLRLYCNLLGAPKKTSQISEWLLLPHPIPSHSLPTYSLTSDITKKQIHSIHFICTPVHCSSSCDIDMSE